MGAFTGRYLNDNTARNSNNVDENSNVHPEHPAEAREELLHGIYSQNDSLLMGSRYDSHANNEQIVIENSKSKATKSFQNPFMINNSSIKLEKDSLKPNIFYITFKYISLVDFELNVYLNANFVTNSKEISSPDVERPNFLSETFSSPYFNLSRVVKSNPESSFFDKNLFIDMENFFREKKSDPKLFDIIFEFVSRNNAKIDSVLAVCCNFNGTKKDSENNSLGTTFSDFTIKVEKTKLKIKLNWYDIYGVYGYDTKKDSSNECETCCINKKNTIFLPCKHSYACSECSMVVRLPVNRCPLCRQVITDCIIIENK